MAETKTANHALQRTRRERRGGNCCVPSVLRSSTATEDGCAGSLSLGR
jgi:hypothetical protein